MISIDCNRVRISRKAFHDFDLLDASDDDSLKDLYLAGYIEKDGARKNVKVKATNVINDSSGGYVNNLTPGTSGEYVSVEKERLEGESANVALINNTRTNFIQFNKLDPEMFVNYNGKEYLVIKFSDETPIGKTTKIYFPNFPLDKGVCIVPKTAKALSDSNIKEVFFNEQFEDIEQNDCDYFVAFIQLVDPESYNSETVSNKTKVIEVLNITSDGL